MARRDVVDEAIAEGNHTIREGRDVPIMGDDYCGCSRINACAQHGQNLGSSVRVERSGGFIGKNQSPRANQRAGDRYTLPLTAGQLIGEAAVEAFKSDGG